jgi:hypothetical protein
MTGESPNPDLWNTMEKIWAPTCTKD